MNKVGNIIKVVGYFLAVIAFIALAIEFYFLINDLKPSNFILETAQPQCLVDERSIKLSFTMKYNGTRPLYGLRVFLETNSSAGSLRINSNTVNMRGGEEANFEIIIPYSFIRRIVFENSTLFWGLSFNYDNLIPLEVAYNQSSKYFKPIVRVAKKALIPVNSGYNLTLYVVLLNTLPVNLNGAFLKLTLDNKTLATETVHANACSTALVTVSSFIKPEYILYKHDVRLEFLINGTLIYYTKIPLEV